jgi:hypothetical protein
MNTVEVTTSNRNDGNTVLPAVKIIQLNLKNATADGYSLGDALLLDKHERDLKALGWTKSQIEELSPNFYRR